VSELYEGWVRHRRYAEPARAFRHRLYMRLTEPAPLRTLEMPPAFGVAFNPVRFHFDIDGDQVRSRAAGVTSTPWGERRTYRFENRAGSAPKGLHVSSFLPMDSESLFQASVPGERLTIHIESRRAGERIFDATLSLARRPPEQLRRLRRRYAAQPLRVLALIYGHAAVLALRGAPYPPHPSRGRPLSARPGASPLRAIPRSRRRATR
jgi:uncharacterized protein